MHGKGFKNYWIRPTANFIHPAIRNLPKNSLEFLGELYQTPELERPFPFATGLMISAGEVVDRLARMGVPVTEADKTCVMMAGLFHDAG